MLEAGFPLDLATLVLLGALVGNEFFVAAFLHQTLTRQDDRTHLIVAQAFAKVLGRIMPVWYIAVLALMIAVPFFARSKGSNALTLSIVAAGLFAAVNVYTLVGPEPLNRKIIKVAR